ncbi:hypothetical protein MIMGU_mgv1a0244072mg, partial [Erythranthe guttata]
EENYMNRATKAGDELMERQKLQLMQLISLLKKIEALVNSSQKNIFQNLSDHRVFMKKFFLKAFTYISAIHQSGQSKDLCQMMLKILKATFDQVGVALGSVEVGVDDLICELAEKMCNPMVEYVNGLKVEMKTGTCSSLLEVVKEMNGAMKVRDFELEEARKQARLAEQSRIDALSKLKKSEEAAQKLTLSLGLLIGDAPESEENLTEKKVHLHVSRPLFLENPNRGLLKSTPYPLSIKEDQAKDDNLLWELLRKKRKCQVPDSPLGPKELLGIETCNKRLNSTRGIPSFSQRPVTRSRSKKPDLFVNSRMLLCSSPSATTQKVLCGKRITP